MLPDIFLPDITDLVIEDDEPVDNIQSAKQQRLLVEPLYTSKPIDHPFLADANVGLFYAVEQPPLVPDAFLSVGVTAPEDWSKKENRSYFFWQFGKAPDVAIEVVSNRRGNELGSKVQDYARIGITYYAVFDPLRQLQTEMGDQLLQVFALNQGRYISLEGNWLESVQLGLTLWQGEFETCQGTWLRWSDRNGNVVATGAERAEQAEAEARQAEAEARQAEAQVRQAEAQTRQAEIRANEAEARSQALADRLRAMGIDPDTL
ncbi:MAG: Uma2 family endonuclease [Verrucomicrobia bacterium]|nr:Uma2 family endonuclease [Leptolyngbya sp. ES-bin-22]